MPQSDHVKFTNRRIPDSTILTQSRHMRIEVGSTGMTFDNVPTLSNRSERLPCVLVVDASGSMDGEAIRQLNSGLQSFETDLKQDSEAKRRVRVMVVQVSDSGARKIVDWVDAEHFIAPQLVASGGTPLGEGVRIALTEIKAEIQRLKDQGIARKKPWLWIFTDGAPTDSDWESAAVECSAAHKAMDILVYPVAVGPDVQAEKLGRFSTDNRVYQVNIDSFSKLFKFMSSSAIAGSSRPGVVTVTPFDGILNQIPG